MLFIQIQHYSNQHFLLCFKVLKATYNVTSLNCYLNLNIKKCYEPKVNLYVVWIVPDVGYYRVSHFTINIKYQK